MRTRTVIYALAIGSLAIPLAGCAGLNDLVQNESSAQFESAEDLEQSWGKSAPWLPSDATAINVRESTAGAPAILLTRSASALDPSVCTETGRQSAPTLQAEWSPTDVYVDRVLACGDWAVIATDDGWFGWTPNDPDEKAASPQK
jgi:hypothetical protein